MNFKEDSELQELRGTEARLAGYMLTGGGEDTQWSVTHTRAALSRPRFHPMCQTLPAPTQNTRAGAVGSPSLPFNGRNRGLGRGGTFRQ